MAWGKEEPMRRASWSLLAVLLGLGVLASPALASQCNDGIDNDGDGKIDYSSVSGQGDEGCSSPNDDTENVGLDESGCPLVSSYKANTAGSVGSNGTYTNVHFTQSTGIFEIQGDNNTFTCVKWDSMVQNDAGAENNVIRKAKFGNSTLYGLKVEGGSLTVEDSKIDTLADSTAATPKGSINGKGFVISAGTATLNRVDISGVEDAVYVGGGTLNVTDSLCHRLNGGADDGSTLHPDCVQATGGSAHVTGSRLDAKKPGGTCSGGPCITNSVALIQANLGQHPDKFEFDHDFMNGGTYQFYGDSGAAGVCPGPLLVHDNVWGDDHDDGRFSVSKNPPGTVCNICPSASVIQPGGAWYNNLSTNGSAIAGPGGSCGQTLPQPPVLLP
jgi:hypothetical protein